MQTFEIFSKFKFDAIHVLGWLFRTLRDAHTNFRTLRTPYSSYSVLVKIAVPRAKIRTPRVRYSSYSVLSVLGAENNDRTPY